uniref:Uncharacterized protein n=1 Tax=Compsopogon caeruleus TaxID=31354 RepID=A0A7S1XFW7_9RHOD|mmetsp:Transcript_4654/g.9366  ORF Transcript_4654/g.9366 Transcript_4654/m.9366 type:complete len:150 (+) Transcript_4654:59-508(+)
MTPKARRKLDRILNDRNLTKLSEADEIMQQLDIEEEEDQFMVGIQSFLGVVVAVTILALFYRGGLWWELWMKEQERRDEEEEIRMTGQFIDPRAERIDDDNNNDPKDQNGGSKSDDKPGPQPEGPAGQDASPSSAKDDGLDALEKLLGN